MARRLIAAIAGATLLSTAALADEISTNFTSAEGTDLGSATLTQTPNGVLIAVDLEGLPEGEHGFHIHERGACDPATKFASAGDHLAGGREHGFKNANGPHAGDLPNVFVGADGVLKLHAFATAVTLSGGETPLLDADGASLMVHAMPDDYASQPSGHAGDRLACATLSSGG